MSFQEFKSLILIKRESANVERESEGEKSLLHLFAAHTRNQSFRNFCQKLITVRHFSLSMFSNFSVQVKTDCGQMTKHLFSSLN
jgi:hypothetical protein